MSLVHDPNDPHHLWTTMDYPAPVGATMASDTIQLIQENINQIPDKSWVVQLFELFTPASSGGTAELDLISEYTGKTRFVAIFMGNNIHYFAIPAVVGHIYRRQVVLSPGRALYWLMDMSTGMTETFPFSLTPGPDYSLQGVSRGIEWHNLQGTTTFPVDWVVSLSPSVTFSTGQGAQVPSSPGSITPLPVSPTPSESMMPASPLLSGDVILLGGILLGAFLLWGLLSSF